MTALKFFPELDKWNEDVKNSVIGPFFAVSVPALYTWTMDYHDRIDNVRSMTNVGVEVAKWLYQNGAECRYWYSGRLPKTSILMIDSEQVFKNFVSWYHEYQIEKRVGYKVFKDKDSFLKTTSDTGEITVQGKVPFQLHKWQFDNYVDQKCFDIWCWLRDHTTHRYWYWNEHFYFESHEDAVLFKLTWYKEEEKKKVA